MKSIVVTGVSSGIGYATTKCLIESGYTVFGSVRRIENANRLSSEFRSHFFPLIFDITDEIAVHKAATIVSDQLQNTALFALINNAGVAIPAPLLTQSISDFRQQIEVNLVGPLIVTQAFAPLLGATANFAGTPGKIINITSISGKIAKPFLGPYAASKHGLEGLSESLRRELMLYGIDVIIVGPGVIKTPIWTKAEHIDLTQFKNSDYEEALTIMKKYVLNEAQGGLEAKVIGQLLVRILASKHPKVRYAPVPKKIINWTIPRLLPKRFVDRLIAKYLNLLKRDIK